MTGEYVKLRDVLDVLSKYYEDVAQYSPRQEQTLVRIKNEIKALKTVQIGGADSE